MRIEIGKTYRTPQGRLATIDGVTRDYPDLYVYSRQGDWYGWNGERVGARPIRDEHYNLIDIEHYIVPGDYLREELPGEI